MDLHIISDITIGLKTEFVSICAKGQEAFRKLILKEDQPISLNICALMAVNISRGTRQNIFVKVLDLMVMKSMPLLVLRILFITSTMFRQILVKKSWTVVCLYYMIGQMDLLLTLLKQRKNVELFMRNGEPVGTQHLESTNASYLSSTLAQNMAKDFLSV